MPACTAGSGSPEVDRVLTASWQSYVRRAILPEGRVVVPDRQGGTISEAQAYALLMAVWAGDEAVFGRVAHWTREHLSRRTKVGDHLLAWQWGTREDGSLGVLDWNTAADADLDYALALVLAHRRGWRPAAGSDYLTRAREVAADILALEVVRLPGGGLVLSPGNWHEPSAPYLINPSYFSPAACRLLFEVTGDGRWRELAEGVYPLAAALSSQLGAEKGVGLFPDWALLHGDGSRTPAPGRDSHFGWEAVRLPWRLALDRLWHGREEAAHLLNTRFLPFFRQKWQGDGRLAAVYRYDGQPLAAYESPVLYAGVLAAALAAGDGDFAGQMARKILAFYRQVDGEAYFEAPDNYYANNWAWLGLAMYAHWARRY
jgi:endoglucanase